MSVWYLPVIIVATTILFSIPVGLYLAWVVDGRYRAPRWLRWIENSLDTGPQSWKQYAVAMLLFSIVMFLFGFAVLALQPHHPASLNPEHAACWPRARSSTRAASFLTNTNLQHYAGELHLSYFSQIVFVVWNMFVSAAVGFCALVAVIRGLRGDRAHGQLLPRHVADRRVRVPAGQPDRRRRAAGRPACR